MRVVFRTDATHDVGAGHAMRCWALAEEFARRGSSVVWQGDFDVPWVNDRLAGQAWETVPAQGHVRQQAESVVADLVIVDSYTLDHSYRQVLLDRGIPVVAIVDDAHSQAGPGSLWINPGAPMEISGAPVRSILSGPDYVLIRQEIRLLRSRREERLRAGIAPSGIVFLLGGTDHAKVGPHVDELGDLSEALGGIAAGPGTPSRPSRIQWLQGGPGLLRRASQASLVVSAAGVSSWELLHIGVPLALLVAADNQRGNYQWMTNEGVAWPLGPATGLSSGLGLRASLPGLVKAATSRPLGGQVVDGLGAKRVVDRALGLVSRT